MNTSEFIEKSRKVHNDKYDYSKAEYTNPKEKVCIICPEHGEFWQKPYNHLNGQGCSKCRYEMLSKKYSKGTDKFIEDSRKAHGDRYDYSKVEYVNWNTKVCIICPEHGEFWQTPLAHVHDQGCPKCNGNGRKNTSRFIDESEKIHGNKYDYSKTEYTSNTDKVCIICPEHGEFWQSPKKHLSGQGCPECAGNTNLTLEKFINASLKIHKGKYAYSGITVNKSTDKVKITCPIHGEFTQSAHDHMQGKGCPICAHNLSKAENEIYEYICNFVSSDDIIRRDRSVLGNLELDIYIPKLKFAIEYNGLRWHSDEFNKDKNYHLNKLLRCNEKGIRLIQVFEDEWIERKEVVLRKIKHILGFNDGRKIYARKCNVMEIDKQIAYDFLDKNHIQGSVNSSVAFGCFYEDDLVGVMIFTKESEDSWNLTRFATDNDTRCVGVAGKLYKAFLTVYKPKHVKSFADRRWTVSENHNVYTQLGFSLSKILPPEYRYVNGQRREHKFGYRKNILNKKYGLPLEMTEREMTKSLGFARIYDCGLFKYEWHEK